MIRASNIRLPGVYFLPSRRPAGLGLPPLDVAGFVGYAERGPLNWPVAVGDLDTYRAVFGGDFALAREQGGRTVYANLSSAVASFFAQGGRRCYVVRVAGEGSTRTRLRLGGLVALRGSGEAGPSDVPPTLATLEASSDGRWSAALRVGARLRSTPLPLRLSSAAPPEDVFRVLTPLPDGDNFIYGLSWATGSAPDAVQRGDVLRLTYNGSRQFLFPVDEVRSPSAVGPEETKRVELLTRSVWELFLPAEMPDVDTAERLTPGDPEPLDVRGNLSVADEGVSDKSFVFKMTGSDASRVVPGDVLRLKRIDNVTMLFPVASVGLTKESGSAPEPFARAPHLMRMPSQFLPEPPPSVLLGVERLRFDLLLREGNERRPTIEELSFNAGHPRFWGDAVLTESSLLRRPVEGGESTTSDGRTVAPRGSQLNSAAETADLFRAIGGDERIDPSRLARFDPAAVAGLLSPVEGEGVTFLPLGMASVLGEEDLRGPYAKEETGADGLESFDPLHFIDPLLVPNLNVQPPTGDSLASQAFDRYYVQDKRLKGLHSLLFVGEVALVSLPEAVQREWEEEQEPVVSPHEPDTTSPPPQPDLSKFHCCEPPAAPTTFETFNAPAPTGLDERRLPVLKSLDPNDEADPQYLSELTRLTALHHALLNFCHARRDAFAVLALPHFYEKRHCVRWQEEFRKRLGLPARRVVCDDARDIADLSYACVYHPWLLLADKASPDGLRGVPPDGAACGMIAARERERQVWVAPANIPLSGVLGLAPEVSTDDWADLFELQFNLVRREAFDFRPMSAHTLADEAIWLQVSVRRLLILIRKFVVERGMDFVFEPNHERFRQGVQLTLEDALLFMHNLGAFAGASPAQSFNVVTDASVNPPQSVDAGRFVAQVQVAPSQPAEFITVLLTRVAEDLLQAREG
jgi:hypothetical protein